MKKITKILIASTGILAGVTAVTKLIQPKAQKKQKEKSPNIVIIGKVGTGKSRYYLKPNVTMECYRHTCHATPTSEACRKGEEEKTDGKKVQLHRDIMVMQSLSEYRCLKAQLARLGNIFQEKNITEDEQTIVKGLINFICDSGLDKELDESVTPESLIRYMKDNGILDEIIRLCAKKGIAFDDTENIIRIVFKAGRFNKCMDAEQKLSVILDELSESYFQYDEDKNLDDFSGEDCD